LGKCIHSSCRHARKNIRGNKQIPPSISLNSSRTVQSDWKTKSVQERSKLEDILLKVINREMKNYIPTQDDN
jgi:hypothetical protein